MDAASERQYVEALRKASAKIKALSADNAALRAEGAIAVVGMGCRLPGGATDPQRFWDLLTDGRDAVTEMPADRIDLGRWWDPDPDAPGHFYVRSAALLDDVRGFDPGFFRITPAEAVALDPQQRLLLEVSWETFEDAGLDTRQLAGSRTGVFIGTSNYDYIQAHIHSGDPGRITAYSGSGVMVSTAAGRLSYVYDLRGPCVALDTACSSSLVALDAAIKALRRRDCDAAIAGGVSLILSPDSLVALCKVRALAPDGRSRAFDDAASGYGRGEGCGLILLKRLEDARRDGDVVQAVLAGAAVNHDGRSNGLTAPNGLAQQAVIRAALEDAALSPDAIDYVEAHGTGTPLGDPIEFGAIQAVFGGRLPGSELRLGSVKTNIGHTEAAAGIAGVIKTILALRHGAIPPSLHFGTPNHHIDWAGSSIRVVDVTAAWPTRDRPRAAGVSSFGLSGTNAHVVVVEAPPMPMSAPPTARPLAVLPLSAATGTALADTVALWRRRLGGASDREARNLCAAAARRTPLRERVVAIGVDAAELSTALAGAETPPSPDARAAGGTAFLFTGQGAQYAGMGASLYAAEPVFRAAFDRCAEAVGDALDRPLPALLADHEALARTAVAQPATFALQWALCELWASWGLRPAAVAGHSIGEYAAAAVAGVFTPEVAIRLIAERGRAMQALPSGGAMAAVFASADTIAEALAESRGAVVVAALNAPEAVTLAGKAEALSDVLAALADRSIPWRRLDVSHAFHSPLMAPMLPCFRAACGAVPTAAPRLSFYSTVTGGLLPAGEAPGAVHWTRQVTDPVRFHEALTAMLRDGHAGFLEIGPGEALAALAGRAGASVAVGSLRRGTAEARQLASAAGALWCGGIDLDWAAIAGPRMEHVATPHYPFQRKPYWQEIGPLRPDPPAGADGANPPQHGSRDEMTDRADLIADLVRTLSAVTGFDPAEVSPVQHLMDMGLDSLMLLRIGQAVERDYGVELRMSQLFKELGTVDDIAAYLESRATRRPGGAPPPVATAVADTKPAPPIPVPAQTSSMPPAPEAAAPLFQRQLDAMAQMAAQNLQSLTELMRHQLTAAGHVAAAPPRPQPAAEPPARSPLPVVPVPVAAIRGINLAGTRLTSEQQGFVEDLVRRHVARTARSKALTRESRAALADWKHTLSFWGQLKEAKYPIVSASSDGARVTDVDGNVYIDVAMGMGVHFFGHKPAFIHDALKRQMEAGLELGTQSPLTGAAARLLTNLTGTERVAFSNTGSEVVMVALRLARAATGRATVVLFKNSYHGIFDGVLATEEEGRVVPVGLGTPAGMIADVVVLPYGTEAALDHVRRHGETLAAVLVEPVQSRDPDLQPQGFLKALRRLTRASGTALVFDEMINGFRAAPGGAQAWFGVEADIVLYGKIVGGGMPIGIVAGKARYLDYIDGGDWDYGDRSGPGSAMIYFGGTFCRNPATVVATHAALTHMTDAGPALQRAVTERTTAFCDRLNLWFERERVPLRAKHFSSQWRLVPVGGQDLQPIELELLYLGMMVRGIYTWERRISFFSVAHERDEIDAVFDAVTGSVADIRAGGFPWSVERYPQPQFTALTSHQRRLFVLSQREGGQRPYHLPQAFTIEGPLDVERLEEAFRTVIARHESLRTAFVTIDGETLAKRVVEPLFSLERPAPGEGGAAAALASFVRPFDLGAAPLMRVAVIEEGRGRHLLLVDAHHIVVDGLSFDVVAAELMAAYEGRALSPVAYDLGRALATVDAGLVGERGRANAAFWKAELDGAPALDLPADRPRPAERDFAGGTVLRQVPTEATARLKALGRRSGASLYMVLLAAWSGLLHRLSGQDDIVVGGAASGRGDPAVAGAVGMFVNTVAFRTRPRSDSSFAEHLASVERVCLAVYDHADYPFEAVAAASSRVAGRDAVFDTMLSYENATARTFRTDDLAFTALDVALDAAMFDIALDVTEQDGALTLRFGHAAALFDRATVERWADAFVLLLAGVLDDPDRPLGRLDLLSPAERQFIADFNDTDATYPADATLASLFTDTVSRHGGRIAVVFSEAALTYADLDRRSDALAAALAIRAAAGAMVGVLLDRSERVAVAQIAIIKAGCVFVPVDPGQPDEVVAHILSDSRCAAVVIEPATERRLPPSHRNLALDVSAASQGGARRPRRPDDVAYVIYTSGSTGRPKGCLVTHRNAVRLLVNDRHPFAFGPTDVWLCTHSFAFDFSIWEVWGAWAHGGAVVIAGAEAARDPEALLSLVRRHRVTVLNQTPSAFYGLIAAERRQPVHALSDHLQTVIFGGDRLEPARLRPWAELYPPEQVALVNMYGITETTVHVTHHRLTAADLSGTTSPIGRPLPETTVAVLGPAGRPQPVGVPGELWVGGSGVCGGYIDRPELTAERFVTVDGRRFYRTGDIGRLRPDGVLDYLGRNDHQVQIRGHRVELAGVQHWLNAHDGVEAAVVVEQDGPQGAKELVAYVVGAPELTAAELRGHLARHLPDHAIPGHFVALTALPLTGNGKLDRAALPRPDDRRMPAGGAATAPRTPVEATVASVWAEVLGRSVGVDQNYMALGGDSIRALQIVSRLHRAGIHVTLAQMLAARTVAALAAVAAPAHSAHAAEARDAAPLTPVQRWFATTHAAAPNHFNNAVLLAADRIDADALGRALSTIVARHDALRLSLDLGASPQLQHVEATLDVPVEVVDLDEVALLTPHAAAAQRAFDLSRPPLLRVVLYRLPDGDRLLVLCHHAVIDGVSWRILLEDLGEAYEAVRAGVPPAPTRHGLDWIDWPAVLERAARTEATLAEIPFWAAVDAANVSPIPCDFDDAVNAVADARSVGFTLDAPDTARLLAGVAEREAGLGVPLLAALALGCRACFGVDRLRVRLEGHGREELEPGIDVGRTIGWFTTIFPVVLDIDGAGDLDAVAARVEAALGKVPRKGIGYGLLRHLTPEHLRPDLRFGPPPEIGFNYLGQFDDEIEGGFRLAGEPTGEAVAGTLRRPEILDVEAMVVGGRLSVTVGYGRRLHRRETAERLVAAIRAALVPPLNPDADAVEAELALSPLQDGMLFHALGGDHRSYVQQFTYRLAGPLDPDRFAEAWQRLADRHQALRAAIVAPPQGSPRQRVYRRRPVPIRREDLSAVPPAERDAAVAALALAERAPGFDLARDPLMRVALVVLGPDLADVVWTSHHIILDGWSLGIAQGELMAIYGGLVAGRDPALPAAPPLSVHLDWLARQDAEAARRFWTARLAEPPAPAAIPGVDLAGRAAGYALNEHAFAFSAATTAELTALAARLEVTLNTVVQGLWAVLLGGYAGTDDVLFGTVASGRPPDLPEMDAMVGLFLQPIPVRVRIEPGDGFGDLARRLQGDADAAEPFHHLPLAEMQRLDGRRRSLFDHLLVFENYPFAENAGSGPLRAGHVRAVEQMHYDYGLVVHPGERLEVKFTFNGNVVASAEFKRIEAQWRGLADAVLADAGRPLAGIDLGARGEAAECPAAAVGTVLDLVEARAAERPDAAAIEEDGRDVTYRTLDARAEALARGLRAAGVGRGTPVALVLPNGIEHVASLLAVWKAGGVAVPLDVDTPARRLRLMAERIAPSAWVTTRALCDRLAEALGGLPGPLAAWQPDGSLEGLDAGAPLRARPAPADPAYVMFTSGSTGAPKPILASHEALRHFIDWERAELGATPDIRVANLALTTFDVSLRDIFLPLTAGGTLCVPPPEARRDGARLAAWLAEAGIGVVHVVPSVFRLALRALEERPMDFPRLRHVLFAGEALWGADVERTRRAFGGGVALRNLYGPSETTLAKCCLRIGAEVDPARALPVGLPLPGTRVLVVREGRPAAPGAIGELFIAPPFAPLGYVGDPALTAEHFLPCPPAWGDLGTLYRTGDLGRTLADGSIEVCGRLDGQVKVNGVRLELGEIEQVAMTHPEVDVAVAVAHKRQDGEPALACYYTLRRPLDPAALRERLALDLPAAAMPHFLVALDAFPLGLNGKIDRRALPKPEEMVEDLIAFVAPDGPAEERVAAIWAEVLGLRRVGVETPFFDLGGDSLRAIRVLTRVNAAFAGSLTIQGLFAAPTVRRMAAALGTSGRLPGALIPSPAAATHPVSHAQRRLWVLAQLGGHPAAYTLPAAYRLDGPLDAEALTRALESLPERHETLRTVFEPSSEGPRQRVLLRSAFRVERVDLRAAADPDAAALQMAEREATRGFDLAAGPLLAASLLALGPNRHVLVFNVHHIVSDAASVGVMVEEIVVLARGGTLPPLRVHAKDHAAAEAAWLKSSAAGAMRDWWRSALADPPERLDLPFDRPPPSLPTYAGDRVGLAIDGAAAVGLRRLAREAGGTLFCGLLALVAVLLQRHAGADEVVLGTPVSCRDDVELEGQVGFYVNLLPLRIAVDGGEGLGPLVARASAALAAAVDHRAYPFDRLVEELGLARDDGRPPVFDVAVVFQDAGQRSFTFDGVEVTPLPVEAKIAKFPLTFEFVETAAGLFLNLEYATDLFERSRMERMAGHLARLMAAAVAEPERPVARLDMLGAAERALVSRLGPAIDLPEDATVPAVFRDRVAHDPCAPAVVCDGVRLSYGDLDAEAEALARALAEQGIGRGDTVAVLLDRSERLVVAFLGILMAGAAYLPLDPTYPEERLAMMLEDSSARILLAESAPGGRLTVPGCRTLDLATLRSGAGTAPKAPSPDDLAYLIYTSGSTGQPKGVLLEHRGAVNLALAQRHGLGIGPQHRILQFAPSSFDASIWEMVMALLNGGCLVVAGVESVRDPRAFAACLAAEHVSVATLPPAYLAELDDDALAPLELLVTAGEAPDARRALRLARRLAVVNAYGPTEATVCASWHRVDPEADRGRPIPIGRAIGNAALLVLDRAGEPAPVGVAGEIHIGGVGLARGYLDRPGLTAAAFVSHPLVPGERLYRTGDRGVLAEDGTLRFVGRTDRQVKLRGYRIELGEVERAIARHSGVAEVAVAVRRDEAGSVLVAAVVPDGPLRIEVLREDVARSLPAHMLPARWIVLPTLPVLPNGKVDHAALPDGEEARSVDAAPTGPAETAVAEAWRAVLGRGGFGRHDRFFTVGGDSIRAIQVVGRLRAAGHSIDMRAFLATPTVAGLAAQFAGPAAPATAPASARLDMAELEGLFDDG